MTCRHAILWFDGGYSQDGSCPAGAASKFPRRSSRLTLWSRLSQAGRSWTSLRARLAADAFVDLEPFGRALNKACAGRARRAKA